MSLKLPADISLYILLFLPIRDICTVHLLSRRHRKLLKSIEEAIFHQLAVSHRFVPSGTSLDDAFAQNSLGDGDGWPKTWRNLFIQQFLLQRCWKGRGSLSIVLCGLRAPDYNDFLLSHFQIDEDEKTIIAAANNRRFYVYDMNDLQLLWTLPTRTLGISMYPLFSAGFLVLCTGVQGSLEVWRRSTDALAGSSVNEHSVVTPISAPSPMAATEAQLALQPPGTVKALRGHFTPHACISSPNGRASLIRLYRLHCPLLAVVQHDDPSSMFCYDIARGIQLRTITLNDISEIGPKSIPKFTLPANPALMDLHLSQDHIAWCFDSVIILLSVPDLLKDKLTVMVISEYREHSALGQAAFRLRSAATTVGDPVELNWKRSTVTADLESITLPGWSAMERIQIVHPHSISQSTSTDQQRTDLETTARPSASFVSAQISPDGRHLACTSAFGLLTFYPDFERIPQGLVSAHEAAQHVFFREPIRDVRWGHASRRLVVTTAFGKLFVLELDPSYHDPQTQSHAESELEVKDFVIHRLPHLEMENQATGSMAITKTRIWIRCDQRGLRRRAGRPFEPTSLGEEEFVFPFADPDFLMGLCYIDFTPSSIQS
ncbi:hypothetical protein BXZ70DRAFT_1012658 [Cristinia sonorae]|uniref:F-box domain-containing protein n=1 Tax=Cristinia sonorae TaxID=1940300 RepID=A0A8K0XKA8_9AGAR|nr:hypothetical protein BXZ70DRAFT_1012658 [Cristinia sonorae]